MHVRFCIYFIYIYIYISLSLPSLQVTLIQCHFWSVRCSRYKQIRDHTVESSHEWEDRNTAYGCVLIAELGISTLAMKEQES